METIRIDILNPKAKNLLQSLANLNLIKIKKENIKSEFLLMLAKFRKNSGDELSLEEITKEIEIARKSRYEK